MQARTDAEVARLQEAAKANRWGHRDATMILIAYRQLGADICLLGLLVGDDLVECSEDHFAKRMMWLVGRDSPIARSCSGR